MKLAQLRSDFAAGQVDKPRYIEQAYQDYHRQLFEYAALLPETDIREISIDASGVVFTTRSTGVRIRCQPGDHRSPPVETFNFNDFEPRESRMMFKLFEGCHHFYDIGANIGWHSLNLAATYRHASFECFEPIPSTHQHLTGNIALNRFTNIRTHHVALAERRGAHTFYFYEACSGNASGVNLTGRPDVSEVECQLHRLDDYIAEHRLAPPDFIKCDVEGAELRVFQGAPETLARDQPIILAEILRKWSAKYGYNPNDIFDLLAGYGYRAFTSDGSKLLPFTRMTEETVETNFFFLHASRHQAQIRRFTVDG